MNFKTITTKKESFRGSTDYSYLIRNILTIKTDSYETAIPQSTSNIFANRNLDIGLSIALIVIDSYLLIATWTYHYKFSQRILRWSNRICVCSITVLVINTWRFQVEIHLPNHSDEFCRVNGIVQLIFLIGNRNLVYTVFWISQRHFYQQYSFLKMSLAKFNCLSYALLLILLSLSVVQVGTLSGLSSYGTDQGCKPESISPSNILQVFVPLVFGVVALFQTDNSTNNKVDCCCRVHKRCLLQNFSEQHHYFNLIKHKVLLLGPVMYPIFLYIREKRSGRQHQKLEALLIRLTVCTLICIFTDIGFVGISIVDLGPRFSSSFIPLCYSINTNINVIAMLLSFSDYRLRLFPFIFPRKIKIFVTNSTLKLGSCTSVSPQPE